MLAISADGCSDRILWLWDVEGPTGATSQLGYWEILGLGGGFDLFPGDQGGWSLCLLGCVL